MEKSFFRKEIQKLINTFSDENEVEASDFILAQYLEDCLKTFDKTVKGMEKRYSLSEGGE